MSRIQAMSKAFRITDGILTKEFVSTTWCGEQYHAQSLHFVAKSAGPGIAKMLRAQNEYEELKAFNLWPFGDLGAGEKSKPE